MFRNYNWEVHIVNGHNYNEIKNNFKKINYKKPTVIFYRTIKGYGIKEMEENPHEWHYKKI
jgi:Transketolase